MKSLLAGLIAASLIIQTTVPAAATFRQADVTRASAMPSCSALASGILWMHKTELRQLRFQMTYLILVSMGILGGLPTPATGSTAAAATIEKPVLVTIQNGRATITLNREKAQNSLSLELLQTLERIVGELETNADVTSVVLTGAGDKVFCGGADLKERAKMSLDETRDRLTYMNKVFDAVAHLSKVKPTLAVMNGSALGGGLELGLACRHRIVLSDNKKTVFAVPEVGLGIIPGAGGTQRLSRLIDHPNTSDKTAAIILAGQMMSAADTLETGYADALVARAELEKTIAAVLSDSRPPTETSLSAETQMAQEIALTAQELEFLAKFIPVDQQAGYLRYLAATHNIDIPSYRQLQEAVRPHLFQADSTELLTTVATFLPNLTWRPSVGERSQTVSKARVMFSNLFTPTWVEERQEQLRAENPNYAPTALAVAQVAIREGAVLTLERGQRLERLCYEVTLLTQERNEALAYFADTATRAYHGLQKNPPVHQGPFEHAAPEMFEEVSQRVLEFIQQATESGLPWGTIIENLKRWGVSINETFMRDGIQSHPYYKTPSLHKTRQKLAFLPLFMKALGSATGMHRLEAASSVGVIEAMKDFKRIARAVGQQRTPGSPPVSYLIFNEQGAKDALEADPEVEELAVVISASGIYSKSNVLNEDAMAFFRQTTVPALLYAKKWAAEHNRPMPKLRCYISFVWGTAGDEEEVSIEQLIEMIQEVYSYGVREFAMSDTKALATPEAIDARLRELENDHTLQSLPGLKIAFKSDARLAFTRTDRLWMLLESLWNWVRAHIPFRFALHLHHNGTGLINVFTGLQYQRFNTIDTAVGNLGGSPFAKGVTHGNIPTEDLVFVLHALGIETGIDLNALLEIARQHEETTGEDLIKNSERKIFGLHRLSADQIGELTNTVRDALATRTAPPTVEIRGFVIRSFLAIMTWAGITASFMTPHPWSGIPTTPPAVRAST